MSSKLESVLGDLKDDVAYGAPIAQLLLAVLAAAAPGIGATAAAIGEVVIAGAQKALNGITFGDPPDVVQAKFDAIATDIAANLKALHAQEDAAAAALHANEDAALAAKFPAAPATSSAPADVQAAITSAAATDPSKS